MRSTLETIDGSFEHALLTTYSINLHFFEQWVMPLLRKAGVRNVVVLADHDQLGLALEDRGLREVGRSYHTVSVRLGPGAFHPKLMLLTGSDGCRLCVSSSNLTVDGQLRNLEAAIVLDGSVGDHASAITDAAGFFRRISSEIPPPSADALLAALEPIPTDAVPSNIRFVHNLDAPLIDLFPSGGWTVVTPYVDKGSAAASLAAGGALTVITDGKRFAAAPDFFRGSWLVEARDFKARRLHAKAYWSDTPDQSWLLLGSPNLSESALMRTAEKGNTEVAIVLSPHEPRLPDVPGDEWMRDSVQRTAPRRFEAEKRTRDSAAPGAFNAWEDESTIVVAGVPAGCEIEFWSEERWVRLGTVVNDRVVPPDDTRPYLIRATLSNGSHKQAIVHRPLQLLRQRLRRKTRSRSADVVTELPLDLEGVRILENVITDLYHLAELEKGERGAPRQPSAKTAEKDQSSLSEWTPAHPGDEPRVPSIYQQSWRGEPDALLALIRSALRLDRIEREDEQEISEEGLDLEDLEKEPEPATAPEPEPPKVASKVLNRYRGALVKLLGRGSDFVRNAESGELADLGFQAILRLHERLTGLEVEVNGERLPLVEPDDLWHQKLELLCAYLRDRGGNDQRCLATARVHLASCLNERDAWEPLDWETLEALAYEHGAGRLGADAFIADAAEDADVDVRAVDKRLQPYADRADVLGFIDLASDALEGASYDIEPFSWVVGEDWFDCLETSPAWRLAGYGAIAGFMTRTPYGVVVENSNRHCKESAHLVFVEPDSQTLYEGMRRRIDGVWLVRNYRPVSQGVADRMFKINSEALREAMRSPFVQLDVNAHPQVLSLIG